MTEDEKEKYFKKILMQWSAGVMTRKDDPLLLIAQAKSGELVIYTSLHDEAAKMVVRDLHKTMQANAPVKAIVDIRTGETTIKKTESPN